MKGIRSVDTQPVVIHNDILSIHNVPGDVALRWFYISTRCSSGIPPSRIGCFKKKRPGSHRVFFGDTIEANASLAELGVLLCSISRTLSGVFMRNTCQIGRLSPEIRRWHKCVKPEWFILLPIYPGFPTCRAGHINVTMYCHSDGHGDYRDAVLVTLLISTHFAGEIG